jgi:hypothetical protein
MAFLNRTLFERWHCRKLRIHSEFPIIRHHLTSLFLSQLLMCFVSAISISRDVAHGHPMRKRRLVVLLISFVICEAQHHFSAMSASSLPFSRLLKSLQSCSTASYRL